MPRKSKSVQLVVQSKKRKSKSQGKRPRKRVKLAAVVAVSSHRPSSIRTAHPGISGGHAHVDSYIRLLADPFSGPPCRTGFQSMNDSMLGSAFYKGTYTSASTEDSVMFLMSPQAALTGSSGVGSVFSSALSSWFTFGRFLGITPVTSQVIGVQPANFGALNAETNAYRVTACGMRLEISYPMTSAAPDITGVRVVGAFGASALDSYNPSNITLLPSARTYTAAGGSVTFQLSWFPNDYNDFVYQPTNNPAASPALLFNPIVISVIGLPTGSRVYYEAISHLEMTSALRSNTVVSLLPETGLGVSIADACVADEFGGDPGTFWRNARAIVHNVADAVEWGLGAANDAVDLVGKFRHALTSGSGRSRSSHSNMTITEMKSN